MYATYDTEENNSHNTNPEDFNTIEIKYREKTDEQIKQMGDCVKLVTPELLSSLIDSNPELSETLSDLKAELQDTGKNKKLLICNGPDSITFIFILCDVTIFNNNSC